MLLYEQKEKLLYWSWRESFIAIPFPNINLSFCQFFVVVVFICSFSTNQQKADKKRKEIKERVKLLQLFCSYGFASLNSLTSSIKLPIENCMNAYWFEFSFFFYRLCVQPSFFVLLCALVTNRFFCLSFLIKKKTVSRR